MAQRERTAGKTAREGLAKSMKFVFLRWVVTRWQPLIFFFVLALGGCIEPNRSYWLTKPPQNPAAVLPSQTDPRKFYERLAVVEVDEQGDLWSGRELTRARKMIHDTPRIPLLLVYIHGWQNNARPTNRDLATFSAYLDKLSKLPSIAEYYSVCGVFIGWRGATFTAQLDSVGIGYLPRFASFWSRLDATNRVAGVPVTRAISQLVESARSYPRGRGVSVLMGYSFGGRILERTFGQALVAQHAFANEQDEAILPADLTILINSASEAIYAREIKLAMKDWHGSRPAIISLTADTDAVTAVAWPFASFFKHIFGGFRPYYRDGREESQRSYLFSTAGHKESLFTHQVTALGEEPVPGGADAFTYNGSHATPAKFFITGPDDKTYAFSLKALPADRPGALPVGGYWVFDVPSMILKGHGGIFKLGGIFSRPVTELLAALSSITQTEQIKSSPRVHLSEDEP